jgi:hypothetical protein
LLRSIQWASFFRFSSHEPEKADTSPSCRRQNNTLPERRRRSGRFVEMGMRVQVRLTRKLAEFIDGVDLSARRVGEVIDLSRHDAEILLAEGWASPVESRFGARARRTAADDRPRRSTKKRPR